MSHSVCMPKNPVLRCLLLVSHIFVKDTGKWNVADWAAVSAFRTSKRGRLGRCVLMQDNERWIVADGAAMSACSI